MTRGPSGRIVVEVDPQVQACFYWFLTKEQLTFKDWLLRQIDSYVDETTQPGLFQASPGSCTSGQPTTSSES